MQSYLGFVVLILVIIFGIYAVVNFGYFPKIELKWFLPPSPPKKVEKVEKEISPSPSSPAPEVKTSSPVSSPSPSTLNPPAITPPPGFTLQQLSPYYKKIKITFVNIRPFGGISSLTISHRGSAETVNVTGWRIYTNKGFLLEIPRGVADYNPHFNLSVNDIYLSPGDYINFYSFENFIKPISFNFRLNKCTGYLNNDFNFQPPLPNYCPGINRQDIISFSGRCQSFILSLGSCRQPTPNEINQFSYDAACRKFLNNLSYGSCYKNHRRDPGFFSPEWRVWLKPGSEFHYYNLDPEHDRLLLFDRQGLLVDEYIY